MGQKSGNRINKIMVVLVLGLVVSGFFLGYFYGQLKALKGGSAVLGTGAENGGAQAPTAQAPTAQAPQQPTEVSDDIWNQITTGGAAQMGDEGASVVMVEFTDFQCPFCARHYEQTESQIREKYIDTGKLRWVLRDLPLAFHASANDAAQAARCAGDQGKYWEMHDKLFEMQDDWSNGDPKDKFVSYAEELGLDSGRVESCLTSEKYKQAVADDLALAQKAGASGTPTFFINGKILVGAQPFSAFEAVIEEAL